MLAMSSCVAPSDRVEITIRNHQSKSITVKGATGGFSRTLKIDAGGEWTGWIPRASARLITVEVGE